MNPNLPRLIIIADGFSEPGQRDRILKLAVGGVLPWVQLRDHRAPPEEFRACARELTFELRRLSPSTRISLNGYPGLAAELGVGVHLGFRSEHPLEARLLMGESGLIGFSAHAGEQWAVIGPCQYITFSPIFPVQGKPAAVLPGLEGLAHMVKQFEKPVFALGGVSVGRVDECLRTGAFGVAVLSGVMAAEDPVDAAARYLAAIGRGARAGL